MRRMYWLQQAVQDVQFFCKVLRRASVSQTY